MGSPPSSRQSLSRVRVVFLRLQLFTNIFFIDSEALYQEQVEHFVGPDGKMRPLTYEELRALPLLDSVIRETLRMHPPIHSIMRYVRDDVPVPATLSAPSKDGIYVVPKGNFVLACPAVSQADPTVWKNADSWDPYRWNDSQGVAAQAFAMYADENGEKVDYGFGAVSKGTESPYQPFGAGKHRCIGEQVCAYILPPKLIQNAKKKSVVRILATRYTHHNCNSYDGNSDRQGPSA